MLPVSVGGAIWLCLLIAIFVTGVIAAWDLNKGQARGISLLLIAILVFGCEITFATANTAGIVIGLCVIATWCFLKNRFVMAGTVFLAVALAIKPHDSGFIWLFFLLSGATYRKRALRAFLMTACIGIAAILWVGYVAPSWMHDWSTNLATISGPGGLNNPGPKSLTGNTAAMVVSLQAFFAMFRDEPRFYNLASYLICGALLAIWAVTAFRMRPSNKGTLFALAAVAPLTMIVTYHRAYDAKLLLLSIPACAILWAERSSVRWPAFLATTLGIITTGDISLAIIVNLNKNLYGNESGVLAQALKALAIRPASIALLLMGVLYLYIYVRRAARDTSGFASVTLGGNIESTAAKITGAFSEVTKECHTGAAIRQ
jgi:hypothetical protein